MAIALIIEPDPDFATMIGNLLQAYGYPSIHVKTATTGLHLCFSLKPELVITEWQLPDMSGQKVCEAIRKAPIMADTAPTLLVSTTSQTVRPKTILAAGADALIQKPLSISELQNHLEALLKVG